MTSTNMFDKIPGNKQFPFSIRISIRLKEEFIEMFFLNSQLLENDKNKEPENETEQERMLKAQENKIKHTLEAKSNNTINLIPTGFNKMMNVCISFLSRNTRKNYEYSVTSSNQPKVKLG